MGLRPARRAGRTLGVEARPKSYIGRSRSGLYRGDMPEKRGPSSSGMVEDLIAALSDKHTQLDLQLRSVRLNLAGTRLGLELNGVVTMTAHMRDLTEKERDAHITHNIAAAKR
ncbi:MAG: hypothetical protein L3K14_04225 [Thermoplasmata archaeon]|nr:hypothetical protein [Thermoplasmata archaeon]